MSLWERSLVGLTTSRPGLSELFGAHPDEHGNAQNVRGRQADSSRANPHPFFGPQGGIYDGFFTLRLEHREGYVTAQHGEEKILLFRSDRAGAIAKIIYSSTPAPCRTAKSAGADELNEELQLGHMAQAKIHVLDVKEQYRGYDFGGLLFAEATASLRNRYANGFDKNYNCSEEDNIECISVLSASVRCQLDAEEDTRRHDKLVNFYTKLGCHVKPNARVRYINNNDGETYRKIPMQIALRAPSRDGKCVELGCYSSDGTLVGQPGSFLPIRLRESSGRNVSVSAMSGFGSRRVDWLIIEDGRGNIQFQTTLGHFLWVDPEGRCGVASLSNNNDPPEKLAQWREWSTFHLFRVPDSKVDAELSYDSDSDEGAARRKELWMLQQSAHKTFLRVDATSHTLLCTNAPGFWQANYSDLSLTCTNDTPPRRLHYRKTWEKQTVAYVRAMRERYLKFGLGRMSLRDALNLAAKVQAFPFQVGHGIDFHRPSLRTLCLRTAETARILCQPDWVQLVALLHALGGIVKEIDVKTAIDTEDDYDWTIICRSRVVGCASPGRTSFAEFRYLNVDERNAQYSSPQGMYEFRCGLENVLLAWTGPEYLCHMLRYNDSAIPNEGLAMLRLFALGDWHTHHEYEHLSNANDLDMKPFVAEFDEVRRLAANNCANLEETSDDHFNQLWDEHYGYIAEKYGLGGLLKW